MAPTVIFVVGSWHTTSHAQPLVTALTHRGIRAVSIQLASTGLKAPRPAFADDVELITQTCLREIEQQRDITLILHSMAGMGGCESLNNIIAAGGLERREGRGRVIRVVLIAAYAFPAGMVLDARDFIGPDNPEFSIDDDDMLYMANARTQFFNDIESDADADVLVKQLTPVYYLYRQPVISSEEWRRAPLTYVLCEKDQAVPLERQLAVSQGMNTVRLNLGHSPFVGHPEAVADVLVALLGAKHQ